MPKRRCAGCWQIKDNKDLIKITKSEQCVIINPSSYTFGRSAYLCYNKNCIENAFKKNRIEKYLKASVPPELKGLVLDELRNNS